jgi:hypothetical protein
VKQELLDLDFEAPDFLAKVASGFAEVTRLRALPSGNPEWHAAQDAVQTAGDEVRAHAFGAFRFPEFRAEWDKTDLRPPTSTMEVMPP